MVYDVEIVPLPVHGDQLVTLTHAADVASMLASVIGNDGAVKQVNMTRRDKGTRGGLEVVVLLPRYDDGVVTNSLQSGRVSRSIAYDV